MIEKYVKSKDCINIGKRDILIFYWDYDKYDMNSIDNFFEHVHNIFPTNKILFIPKGIEWEVVKNE